MELRLPAIKGIGGAPLYLIDRYRGRQVDLRHRLRVPAGVDRHPNGHGLKIVDHLTHNVYSRPHGALGPRSTRSCSTSARSATSTSRASTPA
jgi:hypothetical protein